MRFGFPWWNHPAMSEPVVFLPDSWPYGMEFFRRVPLNPGGTGSGIFKVPNWPKQVPKHKEEPSKPNFKTGAIFGWS
ncbi:unnamed protein product [Blepharisma stoltei]|uniref:Uncharacterized protein n=1 Tax=Blepharisma stoltei TaxID=1481888 RepID=A0AAU9JXM9_9CILI|nr:unnamed protein product [Blepharisma stoltei]